MADLAFHFRRDQAAAPAAAPGASSAPASNGAMAMDTSEQPDAAASATEKSAAAAEQSAVAATLATLAATSAPAPSPVPAVPNPLPPGYNKVSCPAPKRRRSATFQSTVFLTHASVFASLDRLQDQPICANCSTQVCLLSAAAVLRLGLRFDEDAEAQQLIAARGVVFSYRRRRFGGAPTTRRTSFAMRALSSSR